MKRLILTLALLFVFLAPVYAQTTDPVLWVGAGATYNRYAAPQGNGWFSVASRISNNLYSFSSFDVTSSTSAKFTPQLSMRSGMAFIVHRFGSLYVLGFGDGGLAQSSGSVGGAGSLGAMGLYRFKNNWTMEVATRTLKTSLGNANAQLVYEIGFGKSW